MDQFLTTLRVWEIRKLLSYFHLPLQGVRSKLVIRLEDALISHGYCDADILLLISKTNISNDLRYSGFPYRQNKSECCTINTFTPDRFSVSRPITHVPGVTTLDIPEMALRILPPVVMRKATCSMVNCKSNKVEMEPPRDVHRMKIVMKIVTDNVSRETTSSAFMLDFAFPSPLSLPFHLSSDLFSSPSLSHLSYSPFAFHLSSPVPSLLPLLPFLILSFYFLFPLLPKMPHILTL